MEGLLKYQINGEEIGFFCGTYALERSLEAMDASVSDLSVLLNKKFLPLLRHYMYYAAEYYATDIKDKPFPYTERDVYKWLDQHGGLNGDFYKKFYEAFMRSMGLTRPDDQESDDREKKS